MGKGQALIFWFGGVLVFALSFGITLWVTEPEVPAADKIKLLAASVVADEAALHTAANAAGLKISAYLKGHIDRLNRLDAGNVSVVGWAAEIIVLKSTGAPIIVMAFAGGKNILAVETNGERPDVTSAFNLSELAAKDVALTGQLSCSSGQKLLFVGVTVSGTYGSLGTLSCP